MSAKGVRVDIFHTLASAGGPPAQVLTDSSVVKAHRSASGGKGRGAASVIGRSRGRRTTKIHALTDRDCRPIAVMLTGRQFADCTAGSAVLKQVPPARILHGGEGYDSNAIRRQVDENGTMPNIPSKANRRWKNCFSPVRYRNRNAIERMFCRSGLSPRDMIASPSTSSPPSASPQPSATGYESEPGHQDNCGQILSSIPWTS